MDNRYAQRTPKPILGSSSAANPNMTLYQHSTSFTQLAYTQMPNYYPNYNPYANFDQQVLFNQWQLQQEIQQFDQQSHQPQEREGEATPTLTSTKTKRKHIKKMAKKTIELQAEGVKSRNFWSQVEELLLAECYIQISEDQKFDARRKHPRVTGEELELFGADEFPRPLDKERISKSQRASNSTSSSGSNPKMFQDMLQQQYELDRKAKMKVIEQEANARVDLINSQKIWKKKGKNERKIDDRSYVHEVFAEMSKIKKPRQEGSVKKYYDLFNSFVVGKGLDESLVVSLYIWGLKQEVERRVSLFKLKNLSEAYCLANLQETNNSFWMNQSLLCLLKFNNSKRLPENGIREIVLGEDNEASKEHDKNSLIECFEGIDGQWAKVISGGYDTQQTEVRSMENLGENGLKESGDEGNREDNNTCEMIFDKPSKDRNYLGALDMLLELSSSLDIHKDCDNESKV
nr:hypothetical protein [Tanacetum cinerariifolium]